MPVLKILYQKVLTYGTKKDIIKTNKKQEVINMKEIYMLKTLDGFKTVTLRRPTSNTAKWNFPYHEDKDDDLKSALQ